jgi:hypothetical protein
MNAGGEASPERAVRADASMCHGVSNRNYQGPGGRGVPTPRLRPVAQDHRAAEDGTRAAGERPGPLARVLAATALDRRAVGTV